jgi:transcription initiation factor TFIIH subunit 4
VTLILRSHLRTTSVIFVAQALCFVSACLEKAKKDRDEILCFLFVLSHCNVGYGYLTAKLTKTQRQLMHALKNVGLIYLHEDRFYPSAIVINMFFNRSNIASGHRSSVAGHNHVSIIVETNFQVLAYLESDLHFAMICLFVDSRTIIRFPNMVVGSITRDSAKESFGMGIKASQIIDFLQAHAHPNIKDRTNVVPENVSDQLLLWEREQHRINTQDAVLIELEDIAWGEARDYLFDKLLEFARQLKVYIWCDDVNKIIAVCPEGFEQLKSFAAQL